MRPGQPVNLMRVAGDLHLQCIPVDNIIEATEATMNDPLPDPPVSPTPPKYSDDVAAYIGGFAQREQNEAASGLLFAPKEGELAHYPPRQAAIWKQVFAEINEGQEAYHSGQVYVAYRLLARANSRMRGMNALAGQERSSFDVKAALATSDDLRTQLHNLMTPPSIDHAELQSAMLVAEMADWAFDIDALLEGSELVTKQTLRSAAMRPCRKGIMRGKRFSRPTRRQNIFSTALIFTSACWRISAMPTRCRPTPTRPIFCPS